MKPYSIDINCDLGEVLPDGKIIEYEHLLTRISSANIACGGHCGDQDSMKRAVDSCLTFGVAIGAHPSYVDLENFGRKSVNIEAEALLNHLQNQVHRLAEICFEFGTELTHIKPHGALYTDCAKTEVAESISSCCLEFELPLMHMPNAALVGLCQETEVDLIREEFADRAYQSRESLRSRDREGALLIEEQQLNTHLRLLLQGKVQTEEHGIIEREYHSLCVHGDNPNALLTLKLIHQICEDYEISID